MVERERGNEMKEKENRVQIEAETEGRNEGVIYGKR